MENILTVMKKKIMINPLAPKLNITPSTQDSSHILHVFLVGVLLFTPLRERDLYCKSYV